MITLDDYGFGPNSSNRLAEAKDPSPVGAVAALETFYYAYNHRDIDVMAAVWSHQELVQLNNPIGGILRGGAEAVALYRGIFAGGLHHEITFTEAVTYNHTTSVIFVGREFGNYSINGQALEPLVIRATRLFTYEIAIGRWVQLHHHRSIEDPDALRSYQNALIRR